MKVITTAILIALSLLTALILETKIKSYVAIEIILIGIGVFAALIILFGLWIETDWAFPLASIFFALSAANILWMFLTTKTFLTFAFGVLVNVAGLVICMASLKQATPWNQPLETYEAKNDKKKKK
jgi:hypothetical protein